MSTPTQAERLADKVRLILAQRIDTTTECSVNEITDEILRETNLAGLLARIAELEAISKELAAELLETNRLLEMEYMHRIPCKSLDKFNAMKGGDVPVFGDPPVMNCPEPATAQVGAAQLAAINAVAKAAEKVNEEIECTCYTNPDRMCVYCSRSVRLRNALTALRATGWRAGE